METKPLPTKEYLDSLFNYDPNTGVVKRKVRLGGRASVGQVVGSKSSFGHLVTSIMGTSYYLHRLVWKMHYGSDPEFIDHINGDPSDNRISNLRSIPFSLNYKNRKKQVNKTGHLGISKRVKYNKWRVRITSKRKLINIGDFDSLEEAIKARKEAEVKYGFHKNHGRS